MADGKQCRVLHYMSVMNRGGQETFAMNVFRNIDRTQVMFDFLCMLPEQGAYDEEILNMGGRVLHAEFDRCHSFLRPLENARVLYRFLRRYKKEYRAFHIHTQHAMDALLSSSAAKLAGIEKVIVHSHSTNTLYHVTAHKLCRPLLKYLPIVRFACSDLAGKWLYGEAEFKVVRNGIEVSRFSYDSTIREQVRTEQGWRDKRIIGHVGSFTYPKNHEFIIKVFQQLALRDDAYRLVLVGDGELREQIRRQAEECGVADRVEFLGLRSDVDRLYQGMDLLLFPSHYEGLPVTLVEAQASGLPCVISDSITTETDVTDHIWRYPLNEDAAVWADRVEEGLQALSERVSSEQAVRENGYDIVDVAHTLQKFYLA